jgi:hypothetical protein
MISPLRILGQGAAYALFAALLGYFSAAPRYTYLEPGMALIKLSFSHAAQHKGKCRRLSAKEIAALPPNMRRPFDCPRGRLPVLVELDLDGKVLSRKELPPSGLSGDGPASIYERFAVPAGSHKLVARLRDSARTEGFDYESDIQIELTPGQNFVIDFRAETGGFRFM